MRDTYCYCQNGYPFIHLDSAGSVWAMLEARVTREFDERWGGGFVDARRFVETILADEAR